jgi:hypothetical protein
MLLVLDQQSHLGVGRTCFAGCFLEPGISVMTRDQLRHEHVVPLAQVASRQRPSMSVGDPPSSVEVLAPTTDEAREYVHIEIEGSRVLIDVPAAKRRLTNP